MLHFGQNIGVGYPPRQKCRNSSNLSRGGGVLYSVIDLLYTSYIHVIYLFYICYIYNYIFILILFYSFYIFFLFILYISYILMFSILHRLPVKGRLKTLSLRLNFKASLPIVSKNVC